MMCRLRALRGGFKHAIAAHPQAVPTSRPDLLAYPSPESSPRCWRGYGARSGSFVRAAALGRNEGNQTLLVGEPLQIYRGETDVDHCRQSAGLPSSVTGSFVRPVRKPVQPPTQRERE